MEINAKNQSTVPSSKERGVGKRSTSGQTIGNIQILPSQGYNVKTPHVYKYFPTGQQIKRSPRSSRTSRTTAGGSNSSIVLIHPKLPLYTERTMNFYMPRLTFNHSADVGQKNSRCAQSAFVTNHKMSMKKKGLSINDLYSFKQRHKAINDGKTLGASYNLQMFNVNARDQADVLRRRPTPGTQFKTSGSLLQESTKEYLDSPVFVRLITGLERETNIPGHIRADDSNGNILGKVMTKAHHHSLLSQKEPVIPAVFYYK